MKVSDYIVSFLAEKGITDVFGYPGGMVTHLMDSFLKSNKEISARLNYHEQASAFCACGYSNVKMKPGVAYATSGPGATNLITGIANAYYDSLPCIFITGQVNTFESRGQLKVRQKGFQETDIVSIVTPITKYASYVGSADEIRYELEKAYTIATTGRAGPVLLDIPFDVQRLEISPSELTPFEDENIDRTDYSTIVNTIYESLLNSKRPLLLVGAGISKTGMKDVFRELVNILKIPVISSMIAIDVLETSSPYNFGFVGAYGHRYANIIQSKCDLLLCLGTRLDTRQTGVNKRLFSENAKIVRVDISEEELENKVKSDEISICCDLTKLLPHLLSDNRLTNINRFSDWNSECSKIRDALYQRDESYPNHIVREISKYIPENATITTDVGQNQVWIAQSLEVKDNQKVLFSGGHGAMGYSLPAAIGAYFASRLPVISFNGDGGIQMNIQELQFIAREKLPIKIILLNNHSLGMIRHFQEMYFSGKYMQTTSESTYSTPDFCKIAEAYGIRSIHISKIEDIMSLSVCLNDSEPLFVNVDCGIQTYVFPKLGMGRPIYDQEPLLDRNELDSFLHDDKK